MNDNGTACVTRAILFLGNRKRTVYRVMVICSLIARFTFHKIQINVDAGSKC